jgi:hypothetical protein
MEFLKSLRQPGRLAILLFALTPWLGFAQTPSAEYKVQAVYLDKFIQFVDWPADAFAAVDSPLVIGVLGNDPFGQTLDEVIEGETVNNHPVVVRRFHTLQEMDHVHVLYVGKSETPHLGSILEGLKGKSILSVSDIEDFSYRGGIVRFLIANNKVRFRINVDAAREANLQISSKLLQLAEIVRDKNPR